MRWLLVLLPLAVAGCRFDTDPPPQPKPSTVTVQAPEWQVIPATSVNSMAPFAAWRLNTNTGELEFCTVNGSAHCSQADFPDATAALLHQAQIGK